GEGSVVSRTVIDRKVGTVTVFAFDDGQGLSEHRAPYDALVYIIEGEADIAISQKSNIMKEGEMIVMPGNEPHSVKARTRFKMMLVMIRE
ncbi:MAG TPA: cupin domain-containing protein, partial [Spirochaetota bacterium]|nr:cupin domain-containing protein [Spirochaetota bacterium]